MNTLQLLQSVSVNNQSNLTQADSQASSDLDNGVITQAQADAVNAFLLNEEAAGPGSFALAQANLKALITTLGG